MRKTNPDTADLIVRNWMESVLKEGISATQWGLRAKVSPSTITRFLSGDSHSVPSFKTIFSLANAANVPLPGSHHSSELLASPHNIKIPVYSTPVSAGPGTELVDQSNEPAFYFSATEVWLREWTSTPLEFLGFIRVSGSSMEPSIYDGELVLVDFSCRRFDGDAIYVLRSVGDVLQLKRVIFQYDTGGYEVRNDNLKYPAFKVGAGGIEIWAKALCIVGRKLD